MIRMVAVVRAEVCLAVVGLVVALLVPARHVAPPPAPPTPVARLQQPIAVATASITPPIQACPNFDFNGDGVVDELIEIPHSCGTGGCSYEVGLVGGDGQLQVAGEIDGLCDSFVLAPRPGKLADVIATWRLGAVESDITRYRFDGRAYRSIDEQECTRGRCKHVHR